MKKIIGSVTAADIVNQVHAEDSNKLIADFEKFMSEARKKYLGVVLPYYVVAEYCLEKENKNSSRIDVLSIKSERKNIKEVKQNGKQ